MQINRLIFNIISPNSPGFNPVTLTHNHLHDTSPSNSQNLKPITTPKIVHIALTNKSNFTNLATLNFTTTELVFVAIENIKRNR